jgi:hypothetical protein
LINPTYQTYPVPVELPAMREGEIDARYMDCSPALAPVGDVFSDINTVIVIVSRYDGIPMTELDLQPAIGIWPPSLDDSGQVVTYGWNAPVGSAGRTYLLTLVANPTKEGRRFVRDWFMSVLPLLG